MTVWLEIDGCRRRVELPSSAMSEAGTGSSMECTVDGQPMTVDAQIPQPGVLSLLVEGQQYRCVLDGDAVVIGGRRFAFEVSDPRSLRGRAGAGAGAAGPRTIKAPMPGRVVRVLVAIGEEVTEQQSIVAVEAMKMQNELRSPKAGRVARVAVAVGDTVAAGDVLAVVE